MFTILKGEPDVVERVKTRTGADAWIVSVHTGPHTARSRAILVVEGAGLFWASYSTSGSWRRSAIAFRESRDDPEMLGTKIIPWDAVRSIAVTPAYGLIEVTYRGPFGIPHSRELRAACSDAIFAAIHERLGRDLPVERGKARVDRIPLGPEQAGAIVFFAFSVMALVFGAIYGIEEHRGGALGRDEAMVHVAAKLGEAVGPVASLSLAAGAALAGIVLLVRTIRMRPGRRFVRRSDGISPRARCGAGRGSAAGR